LLACKGVGCSIQKGGFILLREYEFTVVAKADLPDADKQKIFAGYEEILKRDGGEFVKRDDWGSKRMAFPIRKNFRGHFMFYDTASTPASIAECERLLRIDENILRYLVIKIGDKVDVEARKVELAKAAAASQRQAEER
jgi:small subunit ribosomal protein S6